MKPFPYRGNFALQAPMVLCRRFTTVLWNTIAAGMLILFGSPVWAFSITTDPSLPPVPGEYITPAQVHAQYNVGGAGLIELFQIKHFGFSNIGRITVGPDEIETFDSVVTGQASLNGNPLGPVMLSGPVSVRAFGKAGNVTGTFDTEMLSMSLTGGPLMIRESPTLPSLGRTSISDLGGGLYRIDSFFDVFTELSLDGGNTFSPSLNSTRVELVPEPATLLLLLPALAALAGTRRGNHGGA